VHARTNFAISKLMSTGRRLLGHPRLDELEFAEEAAPEDQSCAGDVVGGGDDQDSSPAALVGETGDLACFAARRRWIGDDGQDLEGKAPRFQQLGCGRCSPDDNECRCDPFRGELDGLPQTPRPITIE
jgi:hypothetical protein